MSVEHKLAGVSIFWPEKGSQTGPQRILIVGPSGSGKTSLARDLHALLNLPAYDLDDLGWLPNWTMRPTEELKTLVQKIVHTERWILAGNYERTQDLSWPRTDLVIWLDLNKALVLYRVFWRCLRRARLKQSCCNGNYESLRMTFASRDSLLVWIWQTHGKIRQRYQQRCTANTGPQILHLYTPKEVEQLINLLNSK